jgi:NADPH:quinone reductase-like Zn-dependent oxidoreductase
MRALVLRGHGDLSMLDVSDVQSPNLSAPGDVRIALRAAALNHLDLHTMRGLPGLTLDFPHILGADGAGVVESVGDEVTAFQPGDRVMFNPGISCYECEQCLAGEHSMCVWYRLLGEHLPGTMAEFIVVPQQNVARIPTPPEPHAPLSWPEAAGYSLVTLTAWRMLHTRAKLQPGETVLIWGVGGGVSSVALAVAKLLGATVIVTSSSDDKLSVAREMGADLTLNHNEVDVAREVRQATEKRGADVIVDNVGEASWEASLRALGKGGRLVTCGATTGPKVVSDVRRIFWNHHTIMGSTMGSAADYADIIRLLGEGKLRVRIDSTFPLERGAEAMARLSEGKQMGKVVVDVSGEP